MERCNTDKYENSKEARFELHNITDERSRLIEQTSSRKDDSSRNDLLRDGTELRRSLDFKHAFVFVVGLMLGSGAFISPSLVAKEAGNMGMAIVVWIISAIPFLFGALCFCELACMYGKSGGVYLYMLEAYGNLAAFFSIWANALVIVPIGQAVPAIVIGEHIVKIFCDLESVKGIWLTKAVAVICILVATVVNCISVSFAGKTQLAFTIIQNLTITFFIILGIWQASTGHSKNFEVMFHSTRPFDFGSFGLAIYNALLAYEGWAYVSVVCEEIKNPKRNLWLAIITGIPFVVTCFVLINLSLMTVLSHDEISHSTTVSSLFVERIFGKKVAIVVPLAVALSSFGSINANIFLSSRMLLSAAREGHLPFTLCFIHKNKRTPVVALVCLSCLCSIWLLSNRNAVQSLVTYFSFAIWSQNLLAIFSVVVMRIRKPGLDRPFKVWLINPIITILCSLFLVILPFIKRPAESSICLVVLLSAIPVYYVFIHNYKGLPSCLTKAMENVNEILATKFNLVPCVFSQETEENSNDSCKETNFQ